jgi:hypothetical protein
LIEKSWISDKRAFERSGIVDRRCISWYFSTNSFLIEICRIPSVIWYFRVDGNAKYQSNVRTHPSLYIYTCHFVYHGRGGDAMVNRTSPPTPEMLEFIFY